MKLLCWNCQRLGTPLTIQPLRAIVAQERPNLVFLVETKNEAFMLELSESGVCK